jgi:hypothetical protein
MFNAHYEQKSAKLFKFIVTDSKRPTLLGRNLVKNLRLDVNKFLIYKKEVQANQMQSQAFQAY